MRLAISFEYQYYEWWTTDFCKPLYEWLAIGYQHILELFNSMLPSIIERLLRIQDVPGSKLGPENRYPDENVFVFYLSPSR